MHGSLRVGFATKKPLRVASPNRKFDNAHLGSQPAAPNVKHMRQTTETVMSSTAQAPLGSLRGVRLTIVS
jgi:hypothetical protein